MMPRKIWSVNKPAHRIQDEIAEALVGRDQLGHDEIGPGPAQRDAQRVHHAGQCRRDQHARAPRVRRLAPSV